MKATTIDLELLRQIVEKQYSIHILNPNVTIQGAQCVDKDECIYVNFRRNLSKPTDPKPFFSEFIAAKNVKTSFFLSIGMDGKPILGQVDDSTIVTYFDYHRILREYKLNQLIN